MAAASVFVFHAAWLTGFSVRSGSGAYLFQLDVGVDVFFVLSGFLLYRPFVRAHLEGGPAPTISRYYKRRVLRIFPAYWLVLMAVLYVFHQAAAPTTHDGLVYFSLTPWCGWGRPGACSSPLPTWAWPSASPLSRRTSTCWILLSPAPSAPCFCVRQCCMPTPAASSATCFRLDRFAPSAWCHTACSF